ncbi:i-spanin [Stenotrophomonas phage Suso]|nr:i-spanin [Stenotrophomonas phage Suso]
MIDTPQSWAARNAARLAIYLLLAIVLVATWLQIRTWREDARTGAERIEQRDNTAAAAGAIADDLATTTTDRQRVEVRITADTAQMARDLEKLRRENPSLDHWMRADIPVQLRELARQRREARDRLATGAAGRGAADQGARAPGSGDQD